jgi:hypothetical protein
MNWTWMIDDLGLNAEEVLLFDVLRKSDDASELTIRDGIAIFRKFKEWHKQNPNESPDLKESLIKGSVDGGLVSYVEIQWFTIQVWWACYCDARKKVAYPKMGHIFPS